MKFEEYFDSLKGKSVAVIGIGVSNRPLIELLLSRGIAVTACDRKDRSALGELADRLEAQGCNLQLGEGYLEDLDQDMIFRTPGMRPDLPQLQKAVRGGSRPSFPSQLEWKIGLGARAATVPHLPGRHLPPGSSHSPQRSSESAPSRRSCSLWSRLCSLPSALPSLGRCVAS